MKNLADSSLWNNFTKQISDFGLTITAQALGKFQKYLELLLEWNQKINLVSRNDTKRLVPYHLVDSIMVLNYIPANSVVGDLGSGGGLPGIPVKIIRDDIKLYLIESIQKKAAFLSLVAKELNLSNTIILPERAEKIRDIKFDVILIRLLGKIGKIVQIALPRLKPSGKIIFYKSETAEEEIADAKKLLAKFRLFAKIKEIVLPVSKINRRLVILER